MHPETEEERHDAIQSAIHNSQFAVKKCRSQVNICSDLAECRKSIFNSSPAPLFRFLECWSGQRGQTPYVDSIRNPKSAIHNSQFAVKKCRSQGNICSDLAECRKSIFNSSPAPLFRFLECWSGQRGQTPYVDSIRNPKSAIHNSQFAVKSAAHK